MSAILTESGRTKPIPTDFYHPQDIVGLDPDGRIVVDRFGAMEGQCEFVFGLTLCCNASDKGVEHGIVCRGCYSYEETGNYIYKGRDGTFPGLDPIVRTIEEAS